MDPRGTVGRIYKEDHYTLLQTKYESSGPCGFGEEDFLVVFTIYGRGGHLGHVTSILQLNFRSPYQWLRHIKFQFDWPSGFREEDL